MPNAMYVEQSLSRQYRREYNFFSIDLVQIRGNSIEMTELPNLEQIHSKFIANCRNFVLFQKYQALNYTLLYIENNEANPNSVNILVNIF